MVVQADKKYQLADWRVRPLSEKLMLYARSDTHYLLYIYDRLKVCNLSRATQDHTGIVAAMRCPMLAIVQSVHACMFM